MKTFKQLLEEKLEKLGSSGWNRRKHRLSDDSGKKIGDVIDNENGTWTTTRKKNGLVVRKVHRSKEDAIQHLKTSVTEQTVDYEAHDYYGSPKKKVLARKSPSSSGGGAGGNGGE